MPSSLESGMIFQVVSRTTEEGDRETGTVGEAVLGWWPAGGSHHLLLSAVFGEIWGLLRIPTPQESPSARRPMSWQQHAFR